MKLPITDYNHKDLPALLVALSLLSSCDGVLWKELRGNGLVYGAWTYYTFTSSTITIKFSRCSDVFKSYEMAYKAISSLIKDKKLTKYDLDGCKCYTVYELLEKGETQIDSANDVYNKIYYRNGVIY